MFNKIVLFVILSFGCFVAFPGGSWELNFLSDSDGRDKVMDPAKGFCLFHEEGVPQNIYSQNEFLQVDNVSRLFYYEHLPAQWDASYSYLDANFTYHCPALSTWLHNTGKGSCCRSEPILYALTLAKQSLLSIGTQHCDTCHENLMNLICRTLCHPQQSQFVSVTEVIPTETETASDPNLQYLSVIRNVSIIVEEENFGEIWNSCKDVDNGNLLKKICRLAKSDDCSDMFHTMKAAGLMQLWFPFFYTFEKTNVPRWWQQPALNRNIGARTREYYPMTEHYYYNEMDIYKCNDVVLEGRTRGVEGCTCLHCKTACNIDSQINKTVPYVDPIPDKRLMAQFGPTREEMEGDDDSNRRNGVDRKVKVKQYSGGWYYNHEPYDDDDSHNHERHSHHEDYDGDDD